MDSPYFIFGLLVLITGFFLAIAMSIQFCACVKAFRRIQREKARLREIQEAAAQPPPPYAVVVSSCHLNPNNSDIPLAHTGGNLCCIIGTISDYQRSPVVSTCSSNNAHCRLTHTTCYASPNDNFSLVDELNPNASPKPVDIELPPSYEDALKIENAT